MTARLRVDLSALAANYRTIAAGVESAGAVVKADAYGLGAEAIAQTLAAQGCRDFFVATSAEALVLRAALHDASAPLRVFCFGGPQSQDAAALAAAEIIPVINDLRQLRTWWPHRQGPIAVHVDTGMARLGFAAEDLQPEWFDGYDLALLLSHFASADDPEASLNAEQLLRFDAIAAQFPGVPVSLGNSAASLAGDVPAQGLARPGIALYGGQALLAPGSALQPVATFEAQVLQMRQIPIGASVGYGATWTAARPTTVAVVGAGYADGIRRSLSNCGTGVINGHRVPLVGRVSMDLTAFDVTGAAVSAGDWLELFGGQLPLAEVSALLGTIDYEVLTSIGPRVYREYVNAPA